MKNGLAIYQKETFNMINLEEILICPNCKVKFEDFNRSQVCINNKCSSFKKTIKNIKGKYVLVDFSNFMISEEDFLNFNSNTNDIRKKSFIIDLLKSVVYGNSLKTKKNVNNIIHSLNKKCSKILVVGGGTVGAGLSNFYENYRDQILSFDIYHSDNIDLIADAHSMPFLNEVFDFVIIQAVLEHVMYPKKVVSEIKRVLKKDGIIYSETPFMQQVHEGAYDFTRFTESGHRLLFNNFKCIKSGFIGGLGTSLLWSLEYFFMGLFRSRKIGKVFKLIFFWLRFFDYLIPKIYNIDGGCGFFFVGKKDVKISDSKIIKFYNGSQVF